MKKKIGLIIVYSLCALLVCAIVTMSLIKFNTLPQLNNPTSIHMYKSTSTNDKTITKDVEQYDEFMKVFEDAFTEQYISALFTGRTSRDYDVNADNLSTTKPYIKFKYSQLQTLKLNGKIVKDPADSNKTIEYNELYFNITETNMKSSVMLRFRNSNSGSVYTLSCYANLAKLFEYVNNY